MLLEVSDLSASYTRTGSPIDVVHRANFTLAAGRALAIVGESGSGKSQLCLAIMGLLPAGARISGSIRFRGQELATDPVQRATVRGRDIGIVFQDPMTSLTPHLTVGRQIEEGLRVDGYGAPERRRRALAALREVRIAEPERRLREYPHQMSGGMRQRVAIAATMARDPALLIADEPTTALDISVQDHILQRFAGLREAGTAIIFVTHNVYAAAALCDRIAIMYRGSIVEEGEAADVIGRPNHPYATALLRALPAFDAPIKRRLAGIAGEPPEPGPTMPGCAFAARCDRAVGLCETVTPPVRITASGWAACHMPIGC
jgi:oligopeptide/dipeptide ABC transporter ATP-binding protein